MKYLAAYLLLVAGGKAAPTAADIKSVLGSVGVEAEAERVDALVKALEGKTVDEVKKNFHFDIFIFFFHSRFIIDQI